MVIGFLIGGIIGAIFGGFTGFALGGLLGYFLARPLIGGLIRTRIAQVQARFLDAVFAVMGALCKADGQVTQDEIQVAETLFDRLRLSEQARAQARNAFNRGKQPDFDLDAEVAGFARAARGQRPLLMMFIQVQIAAVGADGEVHPAEHEMLLRVARGLGLPEAEVERMEAMLRGASGDAQAGRSKPDLDWAYRVLGVSSDASNEAVKKAYRKLMSENHPDKLASKGMPESMRAMAEEKTRDITTAYDRIKEARGIS